MTSKERSQAWRAKQLKDNPEAFRKYNANRAKRLYHSNPEISVKQQKNFKKNYDTNPEFRASVVRSASTGRYHMTPDQYDVKFKEQDGHCAICPSTDGDAGRRLHIDHNHACCDGKARTCGKCNRGLLCGPCNRRLGALELLMKDLYGLHMARPNTWTSRALQYLKRYSQ